MALPPFYPIIDADACQARGRDPLQVAEACLAGGAAWLQLRAKSLGGARLLALADAVVALASRHGASVVVNDRADVARMSGAAGVHVGQDDLPVEDARRIVGAPAIVGVSTHTREQVDAALETSATYVAVGPIHQTATKETGYAAVGLDLVRYAAGRGKPVVVIGGMRPDRARAALDAGAAAAAVIGDLLEGETTERVRDYLRVLGVSGGRLT